MGGDELVGDFVRYWLSLVELGNLKNVLIYLPTDLYDVIIYDESKLSTPFVSTSLVSLVLQMDIGNSNDSAYRFVVTY